MMNVRAHQSEVASCEVSIEGDIDGVRRCTFLRPPRLKMLRFLEKRFKHSKKPVPPENPPHQTIDTSSGGCDKNFEGGYHSKKISELVRPMGLIRAWHQITTMEGVPGSQIKTGRLGISRFLRQTSQL